MGALGPSGSNQGPQQPLTSEERCWRALERAWLPFAVGWKAVWWECVAVPDDVDDEEAFRTGELACLGVSQLNTFGI